MDTSKIINMSKMFNNCLSLTSVNLYNEYEFMFAGKVYKFTHKEVQRLKETCPEFTFENKNIPRLRKITNTLIKKYYPEDLL